MANAMIAEIKTAREKNKSQKQRSVVANIMSGKILRKYKCVVLLKYRETGMSRKRKMFTGANAKRMMAVSRRRKVLKRERVKKRVVYFIEKDGV